jgi:ribonuclease E
VFTKPAPAKLGFLARMKALFVGEPEPAAPAQTDRNARSERDGGRDAGRNNNDSRRRDGRDGRDGRGGSNREQNRDSRGNRPPRNQDRPQQTAQPQAGQQPQKAQAPQQPKPERSEEQKRLDEARKLEQQQRREEQQRKEAERREAQRQENIKREADRRAAREAARAANPGEPVVVTVDPERGATGEITAVSPEGAMTDVVPGTAEAAAGEGGRRRRGRRGGRRRRRQEGSAAADPNAPAGNSQSEIDFDEEEPGNELEAGAAEGEENLGTPLPFKSPTLASSIPVTSAESDFDDLDGDEPAAGEESSDVVAAPRAQEVGNTEPPRVLVSETIVPPPAFTAPAPVVTMTMPAIETIIAPTPIAEAEVVQTPVVPHESYAVNENLWSQPTPEIRVTVNTSNVPPAFTAPAPVVSEPKVEEVKVFAPVVVAASSDETTTTHLAPSEESQDKTA